ncbi:NACHT domain-containing protein [Flavobacterium sp. 5]|uniref:caspase family protein n=1 Tax=Flavobacterium sp. 5 TaxID=2035199 RepID=UPI000C2CC089|nr:NACHT domain-containing protein [Flavobacterium sp. 5]PKB18043.1 NACHT domain-containing protein [Flavobacterium sp. 5]
MQPGMGIYEKFYFAYILVSHNYKKKMRNHLLLIGIDRYPKFIGEGSLLTTCVKDVQDLKFVLLEKFFFENDFITELINENATNLNIQNELENYSQILDENDSLIIYFSGHGGFKKSANRGFWIPSDGHQDNHTNWLGNETILDLVSKINSKHLVILSDCCFATTLLLTNPAKYKSINLDEYSSRWALTSGREVTYCGSKGENSYFGESIIEFLSNAKEDIRLGSIIEFVKLRFDLNILQKPQGYPLIDKNHKGGEYILKIKDPKELNNNQFRGYKLFKKIISNYTTSNSIEEIEIYESKKSKIGFHLIREEDKVKKNVTFYLYLYEGIIQTKTLEFLKQKHPIIFKNNTIIFIPKEKSQINFDKRINNIQSLFKPLNIYYVDEFIEGLIEKYLDNDEEKYLNIKNFIEPNYKSDNLNIKKWFDEPDSPILVVKGTAGIGKTTFAKYISDEYSKTNRRNVLFIDSFEIQEQLNKQQRTGEKLDLYNLYIASNSSRESSIDKDLFSLSMDAGNLLLIVDGLEEIVSRSVYLDIDHFFNSIISSNSGLGNTKIVITSRTFFWDNTNIIDKSIKSIELQPFDVDRRNKFFKKSFKTDERKEKKAITISEDFNIPNENNIAFYHPFVLDIIKEIVESDQEVLFSDNTVESNWLNQTNKIDYIIYRICEREEKRVKQIKVDSQIVIFNHLAIYNKGFIREDELKTFVINSLKLKDIDDNTIKSLQTHPFLLFTKENKIFSFKYDFFENYFTSLFLRKMLEIDDENPIDFDLINLIGQKLTHGSDTISYIVKNTESWTEDNILKLRDLIEQIIDFKIENYKIKRKAISGLFNLAISINIQFNSNSREHNTKLLIDLFSSGNNVLNNVKLMFINSLESKLRFNFSGITFHNCDFIHYNLFWECNIDKNTFFYNCNFEGLGQNIKTTSIPKVNFINCNNEDNSLDLAYEINNELQENTLKKSKILLESFIRIFYSNGKFKRLTDWIVLEPNQFGKINSFGVNGKDLVNLLKEELIIINEKDNKFKDVKTFVNPIYKEELLKFITEGKQTKKIISTIELLSILMKK